MLSDRGAAIGDSKHVQSSNHNSSDEGVSLCFEDKYMDYNGEHFENRP